MAQYDEVGERYVKSNRLNNPLARVPYAWLAEAAHWSRKFVLDLASGSGDSAKSLADLGASVYGLDVSAQMVAAARARKLRSTFGAQCRFEKHDCRKPVVAIPQYFPELPRTCFNTVTAVYLLNYAESYAELVGMARMARMNLVEGGQFLAVTEHPEYPTLYHPLKQERFEWLDAPMEDGSRIRLTLLNAEGAEAVSFVLRHWGRRAVTEALLEGGFSNVRWHEFGLPVYKAVGAATEMARYETRIGITAYLD